MYKIINSNNEIIGYDERARYITVSENGTFIQCLEPEALGIAYQSIPYHLAGREPAEGMIDDVTVEVVNIEEEVLQNTQDISSNREGIIETFETGEINTSDISDLRSAIIELYEMMEG